MHCVHSHCQIIIILPRTTDGHAIETSSIGPAPEEADVWSRTRIIRFAEGETRIDPTTVHLPHSTFAAYLTDPRRGPLVAADGC